MARRPEQDAVELENGRILQHPAFGQVSVNRVSGGGQVLYGSDFEHNSFIEVTVRHSELHRDTTYERPYGRGRIVSFAMSEAQWAVFVSSFGIAEGAQCTIEALEREPPIPRIKLRDSGDLYKREADQHIDKATKILDDLRAAIELETTKMPQKTRGPLLSAVSKAQRELVDTIPFIVEQFDEHIEHRIEKAKVEIHGYVNGTIQRAGLAALRAPISQNPDLRSPPMIIERSDALIVAPDLLSDHDQIKRESDK